MDDLESFKEARLKMDPTARKLSAGQWKRAYEAHLRAKKRVGSNRRDDGEDSDEGARVSERRSSRRGVSGRRIGDMGSLRRRVREQSAYSDLRLIIDVLAWIAIAVVVLTALVPLFFNTPIPVSLVAVLNAVIGVISVVAARLLVHVLIDIPDIALFRLVYHSRPETEPDRSLEKTDEAE
ncbi:MAG: hypothetical protein GVY36_13925 [Verrucomicrobia bacterium]|jgi:hypothetical protein|nr:hypothetical protein [Verrucomicrobiota bacterium]